MRLSILLAACSLLISAQASANFITNGDFQTCNFDGWGIDADGSSDTSDFTIVNNNGDCAAQIGMANIDPVFGFANVLFTELDLSFVADGEFLNLNFDWMFEGADLQTDPASDDIFSVVLNGDKFTEILFGFESGSGTFSMQLDNTFDAHSLEFILQPGFNPESFSSFLTVDNVSLTQSTAVPAPQTSILLALGLGLVALRRVKHNK